MTPRTVAVTDSASGMGAATRQRLEGDGARVIGVDVHDAEVVADLGTVAGRAHAVDAVASLSGGCLDGLVTFAGVMGMPERRGSLLVSINYFGTVELLAGLRPALAAGDAPAAVAISSNSTTCQPRLPLVVTEACLAGDEAEARTQADADGAIGTYAATKIAVARWVRRHAPQPEWAGAGITLNAVAPGLIATPMTDEGFAHPEMGPMLQQFPIPVGRPGTADELAGLVAFLLGPDARFLCGSLLFADGGTDALLRPDTVPVPWVT